ncbi:MAG TPA: hypothetical protein VIL46_09235, partial [Gemmataceae bacterium]
CGTLYNVTPNDVGRRIACKKCRAPLNVGPDGLRLEEGAAAPPGEAPAFAVPAAPAGTVLGRLRGSIDPPTMLIGAGMFLVVVFAFFPLIDQARVLNLEGAIRAGDYADQLDEWETNQLNKGNPTPEDRSKRAARAAEWRREKERLGIEVNLARANADRAVVWNRRGMLLGFVLLSLAGVGFLATPQPGFRKVLGGVLLLLVFLAATQGGVQLKLGP